MGTPKIRIPGGGKSQNQKMEDWLVGFSFENPAKTYHSSWHDNIFVLKIIEGNGFTAAVDTGQLC